MSEDEIPADVLAAAKRAAYGTEQTGDAGAVISSWAGVCVIAAAITTERLRCLRAVHSQLILGGKSQDLIGAGLPALAYDLAICRATEAIQGASA